MKHTETHTDTRKRPISLTIRADLIELARELELNTSQAAEAGIAAAVKAAREKAWRQENRAWIEAHNERVAREGTVLTPRWMNKDAPL